MTGFAARFDTQVRPGAPPRTKPVLGAAQTEVALRLLTFVALAGFVLLNWYGVVQHPPVGSAVKLLVVCAAGGIGLVLTASPRLPLPAARAARVAIVLGIAVVALLATGLPAHYLRPHRWGSFGNHLNHGLLIAQAAMYPYKGGDPWTRLTLLLNGAAFLVPATALAFWPVKRHARELRTASLVLLIVLYGMSLAERSPSGQVGRGFVLLLLIAAWLWLPRISTHDLGAASFAVFTVALVAMPVAATLDSSSGWLNYRNWRVLGQTAGVNYQWNHSYGPINWPRRGTTLLYMQANRPYYWKADRNGNRLPYLDEITFLFVGNEDAQILRFQSGETSVISRFSPENYSSMAREQQSRGYDLVDLGPSLEYNFLFFNLNELPPNKFSQISQEQVWFRDLKFREAVSLAIDRQSIVKLAYGGRGAATATLLSYAVAGFGTSFLYAPMRRQGRIILELLLPWNAWRELDWREVLSSF